MKTLLNKWFITGCLVWVAIYSSRMSGHPVKYLNGYIDDFFAVPVIANLGLWFKRVFIIKDNYYILSGKQVAFIIFYISIVFEVILPNSSPKYTADPIDFALYLCGGCFFYYVMNKPLMYFQ